MPACRFRVAVPVILCLSVAGLAAQACAAEPSGNGGMGGGMTMPAAAAGSADAQMQDGMHRMQDGMRNAPLTGDPDHDFVSMMLVHHEGAVSMAKVELQHGKDASLLRLAHDIIASQQKEIVFMKNWLAAHPAAADATAR